MRSRQEVHEKTGSGRPFGQQDVEAIAREYVQIYGVALGTNFGGRHFAFRYEDVNTEGLQTALARFVGVDDLMARPLWDETPPFSGPWNSPKYRQPIDLTPRLSPLAGEFRPIVDEICRPIMERLGYQPQPATARAQTA